MGFFETGIYGIAWKTVLICLLDVLIPIEIIQDVIFAYSRKIRLINTISSRGHGAMFDFICVLQELGGGVK